MGINSDARDTLSRRHGRGILKTIPSGLAFVSFHWMLALSLETLYWFEGEWHLQAHPFSYLSLLVGLFGQG